MDSAPATARTDREAGVCLRPVRAAVMADEDAACVGPAYSVAVGGIYREGLNPHIRDSRGVRSNSLRRPATRTPCQRWHPHRPSSSWLDPPRATETVEETGSPASAADQLPGVGRLKTRLPGAQ